jgi:hypothetical protein
MKQLVFLLFVGLLTISACTSSSDDPATPAGNTCDGPVCSPQLASGETPATIPTSLQGTYHFTYGYQQAGSPYVDGTKATFTLTANNELLVEIDGEQCMTLKNPAFRFGDSGGNYFFKDDCDKNICYNVSANLEEIMNEINVQPLVDMGWYGQFVLD